MKKFFAILAFLTVAFSVNAQIHNLVSITTDCKITNHLSMLFKMSEDEVLDNSNANFNWNLQIEWVQLGNGGICKLWIINEDGEKILVERWSNLEYLSLKKANYINDSGVPYTIYRLHDNVFGFFTVTVDENGNANCLIRTDEL